MDPRRAERPHPGIRCQLSDEFAAEARESLALLDDQKTLRLPNGFNDRLNVERVQLRRDQQVAGDLLIVRQRGDR